MEESPWGNWNQIVGAGSLQMLPLDYIQNILLKLQNSMDPTTGLGVTLDTLHFTKNVQDNSLLQSYSYFQE